MRWYVCFRFSAWIWNTVSCQSVSGISTSDRHNPLSKISSPQAVSLLLLFRARTHLPPGDQSASELSKVVTSAREQNLKNNGYWQQNQSHVLRWYGPGRGHLIFAFSFFFPAARHLAGAQKPVQKICWVSSREKNKEKMEREENLAISSSAKFFFFISNNKVSESHKIRVRGLCSADQYSHHDAVKRWSRPWWLLRARPGGDRGEEDSFVRRIKIIDARQKVFY